MPKANYFFVPSFGNAIGLHWRRTRVQNIFIGLLLKRRFKRTFREDTSQDKVKHLRNNLPPNKSCSIDSVVNKGKLPQG